MDNISTNNEREIYPYDVYEAALRGDLDPLPDGTYWDPSTDKVYNNSGFLISPVDTK